MLVANFGSAAGGEDSSIFSALGISGQAFLIQLVTLLIAFLVLRQWAFKPILKVLDERRKRIEDGLTLGAKMEADKEKLEATIAAELRKTRKQSDRILADADTAAKQTVQAAEEAARKRADSVIQEAHEQIKYASERERKRLQHELVGLVADVSQTVIQEKMDSGKDAALIERALKERITA